LKRSVVSARVKGIKKSKPARKRKLHDLPELVRIGIDIRIDFTLGGERQNEIRFSGADISQAVAPLGPNGFNIPSLLSAPETALYFYSGLAQSLEDALNGSQDTFGGVRHHFAHRSAAI
jgi:hypothetical protein